MDMKQKMAELDARIAARREALDRKTASATGQAPVATKSTDGPLPSEPQTYANPVPAMGEDTQQLAAFMSRWVLGDICYWILKYMVLIVLPAIGSLYFGLSKIWGFPFGEEITGTISLVCTFLGTLIGVSSYYYYKGKTRNTQTRSTKS